MGLKAISPSVVAVNVTFVTPSTSDIGAVISLVIVSTPALYILTS